MSIFKKRRKLKIRRKSFTYTIPYLHELGALALAALGVFLVISFFSFDPHDASWFFYRSNTEPISNWCGVVGAHVTGLLFYLFGGTSLIFVVLAFYGSYYLMFHAQDKSKSFFHEEWDRLFAFVFLFPVLSALTVLYKFDIYSTIDPGGRLGFVVHQFIRSFIDTVGSFVLLNTVLLMCIILLFRVSFVRVIRVVGSGVGFATSLDRCWLPLYGAARSVGTVAVKPFYAGYGLLNSLWRADEAQRDISVVEFETMQTLDSDQKSVHDDSVWELYKNKENNQNDIVAAHVSKSPIVLPDESLPFVSIESQKKNSIKKKYHLPNTEIFNAKKSDRSSHSLKNELKRRAAILEEKLNRFGVNGKVADIKPGPVVTLFEYEPDIDIKLSKILALEDDLALALRATSIRILAPIPGKSVVGFEVANQNRKHVHTSSVIRSKEFKSYDGNLPLILGEDTVGNNVIVDLARMPHLLVAGSTGSGKSVALNTMLMSLLCSKSPDTLKLILIDPKRLEFATYADIAHLLFPIVTDTRKAMPILKWVVQHMEERYELMAKLNVRSVADYNRTVSPDDRFPFIVVVIDELADLMMTSGKEVEDHIARIAQMARASGIHLIIATQRPSVDVITGLIKVNFPSRISFRVTSKVDSRTILDASGADKLLGRGDMLFLNAHSSHLQRVHGSYVSDKEIADVVRHIKKERAPEYLSIEEVLAQNESSFSATDDVLYKDVLRFLETIDEVSISLLQRQFRIGYNRSARIIDTLESQGKILPSMGGKTRKVIR